MLYNMREVCGQNTYLDEQANIFCHSHVAYVWPLIYSECQYQLCMLLKFWMATQKRSLRVNFLF